MARPTRVIIDLHALQHNLTIVRQLAPAAAIIAMVKANAYGHGLETIAKSLSSVEAFGVATIAEGMRLRAAGIEQPIVLMEGLTHSDELVTVATQNFTIVLHHQAQLEQIKQAKKIITPLSSWLKINTGMNRLGFPPFDIAPAYHFLHTTPFIKKPIGLMTHFAQAEASISHKTDKQLALFKQVTASLPGPRSTANSAAILTRPETHYEWIRPGLMLYGASPFSGQTGTTHQLQPVMHLQSALIAIQSVKQGDQVGYGSLWTAPCDGKVGIAAIGYGDGYPQQAPSGTPVLVGERLCSLAGRVSMDMLAIDLSNHPQATVGTAVTLWGKGLPVECIAEHCDTSPYELLTRLTSRPAAVCLN